jgi:hypothetical protein
MGGIDRSVPIGAAAPDTRAGTWIAGHRAGTLVAYLLAEAGSCGSNGS